MSGWTQLTPSAGDPGTGNPYLYEDAGVLKYRGTSGTAATIANADSTITATTPAANTVSASQVGYIGIPVSTNPGTVTLTSAYAGKTIYTTTGTPTYTIPANGSTALEVGTTVVFVNGNTTCSIAITTDTLTLVGEGSTGTRSLAAYGMATAVKVASTSWVISGVGLS